MSYCKDTFNVNHIKKVPTDKLNKVGNLEDYISSKIPEVIDLDSRIDQTVVALAAMQEQRKMLMEQEVDTLKRVLGIEEIMDKNKVLSQLANDAFTEGENVDKS